jgi:hypothetical protein
MSAWRVVGPVLLVLAVLAAGCGGPATSRFDAAETQRGPAVSTGSLAGGAFNQFFPKAEGEFDLVYDQEKTGTAVASLNKNGTKMATLSITDTVNNPDAAKKYDKSTSKVKDHPYLKEGRNRSGVLVADRFQVLVVSDPEAPFDENDRMEWLQKFDLAGLAKLNRK